jgi:hypothetical protein
MVFYLQSMSLKQINYLPHNYLQMAGDLKMNKAKAVFSIIMIILSILEFYLTYEVYSVLNDWSNLSAFMAISSLMFLLIGLYLLLEEINTLD